MSPDLNRKYCVKAHIDRISQSLWVKGNARDVDGFALEVNANLTKAAGDKLVTFLSRLRLTITAGITGKQFGNLCI